MKNEKGRERKGIRGQNMKRPCNPKDQSIKLVKIATSFIVCHIFLFFFFFFFVSQLIVKVRNHLIVFSKPQKLKCPFETLQTK